MNRKPARDKDRIEGNEFWEGFDDNYSLFRYFVSEPMIEVRDEGSRVKILMEASGSRERDVRVERVRSRTVDIVLKYKGRQIRKRVELPSKVRGSNYTVKVKNGVAQIILVKD